MDRRSPKSFLLRALLLFVVVGTVAWLAAGPVLAAILVGLYVVIVAGLWYSESRGDRVGRRSNRPDRLHKATTSRQDLPAQRQRPVSSADGSWHAGRWWTAVDSSGAVYLSRRAYGGEYLHSTGLVERWTSAETREVLLVDSLGTDAHPMAARTHWDPELICVDGPRLFVADSRRSVVRLVAGQLTSQLSGGSGLGDWDRHAGGDPDADPPSYTAIVGDGEGGVYVADPENQGVIHVGRGGSRLVSGLQPSAMALDSAGVLLLATRDGITDVTGRQRWSSDQPVAISAMVAHGSDLFVAAGSSLLRIGSDGSSEVLAPLEKRIRAFALSDDGRLLAVDDDAINSRRSHAVADLR